MRKRNWWFVIIPLLLAAIIIPTLPRIYLGRWYGGTNFIYRGDDGLLYFNVYNFVQEEQAELREALYEEENGVPKHLVPLEYDDDFAVSEVDGIELFFVESSEDIDLFDFYNEDTMSPKADDSYPAKSESLLLAIRNLEGPEGFYAGLDIQVQKKIWGKWYQVNCWDSVDLISLGDSYGQTMVYNVTLSKTVSHPFNKELYHIDRGKYRVVVPFRTMDAEYREEPAFRIAHEFTVK